MVQSKTKPLFLGFVRRESILVYLHYKADPWRKKRKEKRRNYNDVKYSTRSDSVDTVHTKTEIETKQTVRDNGQFMWNWKRKELWGGFGDGGREEEEEGGRGAGEYTWRFIRSVSTPSFFLHFNDVVSCNVYKTQLQRTYKVLLTQCVYCTSYESKGEAMPFHTYCTVPPCGVCTSSG